MTRYKNVAREEAEDAELERLEEEYRKQYAPPGEVVEETIAPVEKKEDESWQKRYRDLQSYTAKQVNEAKAREEEAKRKVAELERAAREADNQDLDHPETIEQAREWVSKYPDLAKILRTIFRDDMRGVEAEVHSMKEELEKEKFEVIKQRAFAKVLKAHPDFMELIENAEFQTWVDTQPEKRGRIGQSIYNALRNELDPDAAIEAVNIYKQDNKPKKSQKQEELETLKSVRHSRPSNPDSSGKPTFLESQIEAMHIRDYERLEDQIEEARRENRIVYDISGAAR